MAYSYERREIMELVWLTVYMVIFIGIFSLIFGLGFGGFERESVLQKNMFYIGYGIIFLLGIIALKIAGIFIFGKKHANIEGVTIHDPEQSPFPNFRVIQNPWLLSYACFIVFGALGWLATRYQTFFTAVPKYEQQFTKGADLFFSVYPASPSETLGAIFLISLFGFFLGYMVMKQKLSKGWFLALFIIVGPIISTIYGIVNHLARYGGQEIAMSSVAIFWFFGGLITVLSGSMIPFLILHDVNNFYYKFSTLFGSEIVTFTSITVLLILLLFFLLIVFKKPKVKS